VTDEAAAAPIPDHLVARSVLIMSCDIVGSTAYKQRRESPWQRTFLSFYREFPQQLATATKAQSPDLRFALWKGIGDELLFTCDVTAATQVFEAVRVWLSAMDAYERSSLREHGLGTKGGAFIATLPGPDSACSIPRDPAFEADTDKGVVTLNSEALAVDDLTRFQYDYFGPSIDTGFRVIGASSQRYFTLSVETAWVMQYCNSQANDQRGAYGHCRDLDDLVFLGTAELKGVWNHRAYPMLAIDRESDDPVHKAMRAMDSSDPNVLSRIGELCSACLKSDNWPSTVYLPDTPFEPFNVLPTPPVELAADNQMIGAETEPLETVEDPTELDEDAPTE
jgi:hypothetical protein